MTRPTNAAQARAEILRRLNEKRREVAELEVEAARLSAEIPSRHELEGRYDLDANGCWRWLGARNRAGYGRISVAGKSLLAHRYSWALAMGDIPGDMTVDHACFNKACINPAHLRLLTLSENSKAQRKASRTECAYGHPMTGDNVLIRKDGNFTGRRCRECERASKRRSEEFRLAETHKQKVEFGESVVAALGSGRVVRNNGKVRTYIYIYVAQLRVRIRTRGELVIVGPNLTVGNMSEAPEVIAARLTDLLQGEVAA